jgi:hypothetical protein
MKKRKSKAEVKRQKGLNGLNRPGPIAHLGLRRDSCGKKKDEKRRNFETKLH